MVVNVVGALHKNIVNTPTEDLRGGGVPKGQLAVLVESVDALALAAGEGSVDESSVDQVISDP